MIPDTSIRTFRLLLKNVSLNDFERFFSMSKDPEVMKYIGDGSIFHWTKKVALEKFTAKLNQQNDNNPETLAVYTKKDRLYIGWCGIGHSKFLDHIELGYRYCSDSWNKGYATEAAAALLQKSYLSTDADRILACTHPENTASIRVLEKLGFTFTVTKPSRASGLKLPVFQIDRQAFAAGR